MTLTKQFIIWQQLFILLRQNINMQVLKITAIIVISLCIIFFAFYFFYFLRQPERQIPNNESIFVSPANWKIIAIIENPTEDEILYKNHNAVLDNFISWIWSWATMVSIMMTPLDVHYQKAPNTATLIKQEYFPWKKHNAMKKNGMKATFKNEYNSMLFEMENGTRFKVIQIAGKLARRIVPMLKEQENVKQWDTIWLIKFWSQVTIIFDSNVEIVAKTWDIVIDGETVLAKFK